MTRPSFFEFINRHSGLCPRVVPWYIWECCSQTWKERCLGCAGLNFDALPLAELSHIVQKTGIPGMLATLTEATISIYCCMIETVCRRLCACRSTCGPALLPTPHDMSGFPKIPKISEMVPYDFWIAPLTKQRSETRSGNHPNSDPK